MKTEPKYPRDPADYHRMMEDRWRDPMEVVELQREDLRLQKRIDEDILQHAEWHFEKDRMRHHMVVEMRHFIYGKKHPDEHVIRFPSDWWQAVKERFAPAWFRERWPVKFTSVTASLKELYPDVRPSLPDRNPIMKFAVKRMDEYPIW